MLALLLCLISVTRYTFGYLSNKVFKSMEHRSYFRRRQSDEEDTSIMDYPIASEDESDFQEGDDDVLDDDVSPLKTPSKTKRRANSVIDSIGINEAFVYPGHVTPQRPTSEASDELSPDQGYSATPDQSEKSDRASRKPDAVDASRNVAVDEDYSSGIQAPITVEMPVHKDAIRYNMSHKSRGKCVIFNHEIFETGFDSRIGSTADALRIKKTFQNLGFGVDILDNLPHSEVIAKITELSEEDHTENDCICIFILTHGLSNDLISAKDVAYRSDNIWKPFTADKCTTLAGKPKLFFFQACRGDKLDGGVMVRRSSERTETDSSVASYKIPTHADFLIAHSTVQGFLSWRNPEEGTWYVQCLCDIIDEHWRTMDLLSMLTITARKVATEFSSYDDLNPAKHEQKQVPSITSMLIRDIYFTPK